LPLPGDSHGKVYLQMAENCYEPAKNRFNSILIFSALGVGFSCDDVLYKLTYMLHIRSKCNILYVNVTYRVSLLLMLVDLC